MDSDGADRCNNLTGKITMPGSAGFRLPEFCGSYSNVYRGEFNGQMVAVKIIKPVGSVDTMRRKVLREWTIWEALDHPNILPFLGHADDDAFQPFGAFISLWYPKGDAGRFLENQGDVLQLEERIMLWRGVVQGVSFLHASDPAIVHGDLKPANVLIDDDGTPRICDFGLARIIHESGASGLTTTTEHTGTERYLAPELVMLDHATPTMASDIYALGCLGLEFIHLQKPYAHILGAYRGRILMAIRAGDPPATSTGTPYVLLNPHWDVLVRCWQTNPEGRPSAEQVLRQFPPSESAAIDNSDRQPEHDPTCVGVMTPGKNRADAAHQEQGQSSVVHTISLETGNAQRHMEPYKYILPSSFIRRVLGGLPSAGQSQKARVPETSILPHIPQGSCHGRDQLHRENGANVEPPKKASMSAAWEELHHLSGSKKSKRGTAEQTLQTGFMHAGSSGHRDGSDVSSGGTPASKRRKTLDSLRPQLALLPNSAARYPSPGGDSGTSGDESPIQLSRPSRRYSGGLLLVETGSPLSTLPKSNHLRHRKSPLHTSSLRLQISSLSHAGDGREPHYVESFGARSSGDSRYRIHALPPRSRASMSSMSSIESLSPVSSSLLPTQHAATTRLARPPYDTPAALRRMESSVSPYGSPTDYQVPQSTPQSISESMVDRLPWSSLLLAGASDMSGDEEASSVDGDV